jgi:hypothetical protein
MRMLRGERVAVLAEGKETCQIAAAAVFGITRPLVVLRMDRGDLPFRSVDKQIQQLGDASFYL